MAKVLTRLTPPLAEHYTVFERDQVLTHGQLNDVADWLDQQTRLSRVSLTGTGLVAGLVLGGDAGQVSISPGLGITCDGDLIRVDTPLLLTALRPYDDTAPRYEPFFDATTGRSVILGELVATDDAPPGQPLAGLPGILERGIVVLLAETSDTDRDLCTGADCDNLGQQRRQRLRVLLADRRWAGLLTDGPVSVAARARDLPEAIAYRPHLDAGLVNAETLASRYQESNDRTVAGLQACFTSLSQLFPELLLALFQGDPMPDLSAQLLARLVSTPPRAVQVFSDFLRDLVASWNELRDALLDDDSISNPSVGTFPKHLGLGRLGDQGDAPIGRSRFHPAASAADARHRRADAHFLLRRLASQIDRYQVPEDIVLRVTPSHGEDRPLGERAIPWYYTASTAAVWNRRLTERRLPHHNLGYRAADYGGSQRALAPLAGAIGGHEFFRVEGHLGRKVEEVMAELKKLIAEHNLPFQVHAVLAHNRKDRIRIRPGIRYTDLHRFHYLLRQDVSLRLEESDNYAERFTGSLRGAVERNEVPAETDSGASVLNIAGLARSAVGNLAGRAKPALDSRRYSVYRSTSSETRWSNGIGEALGTLGGARSNLGPLARSDFASPLDSLIQTTHPLWLDWLDDLIQAKDDKDDDKLLLARFAADHPGLDHLGGVWRGGTLLLVYDDSEQVVGDFTLAYPCAEADEPEPVEPPLVRPPQRRPPIDLDPIRPIRPVDRLVGTLVGNAVASRFDSARAELAADLKAVQADVRSRLETQAASVEGLVKGVFSTREATGAGVVLPGKSVATGNLLVDEMVRDVEIKRQKVQSLVELTTRGDLPAESREDAQALLARAQAELGASVADAAEQVVKARVDTSSGSAAGVAAVLANSAVFITDAGAAKTLGSRLDGLRAGNLDNTQTVLIGNIQSVTRTRG